MLLDVGPLYVCFARNPNKSALSKAIFIKDDFLCMRFVKKLCIPLCTAWCKKGGNGVCYLHVRLKFKINWIRRNTDKTIMKHVWPNYFSNWHFCRLENYILCIEWFVHLTPVNNTFLCNYLKYALKFRFCGLFLYVSHLWNYSGQSCLFSCSKRDIFFIDFTTERTKSYNL